MIVEGQGDVEAIPSLVGKVGAWLGAPIYTSKPIRAGGWGRLKRVGGLEKLVAFAASRLGCERIVIVVDLDDGCPVNEKESVNERLSALSDLYGKDIELCFCIREIEAWYLRCIDLFRELILNSSLDLDNIIENAGRFRDAKGKLRETLKDGYDVSADQKLMTSHIDPFTLYNRDRSFRCFVKAVSGFSYDLLSAA